MLQKPCYPPFGEFAPSVELNHSQASREGENGHLSTDVRGAYALRFQVVLICQTAHGIERKTRFRTVERLPELVNFLVKLFHFLSIRHPNCDRRVLQKLTE